MSEDGAAYEGQDYDCLEASHAGGYVVADRLVVVGESGVAVGCR